MFERDSEAYAVITSSNPRTQHLEKEEKKMKQEDVEEEVKTVNRVLWYIR
jgi:hypothetical protein